MGTSSQHRKTRKRQRSGHFSPTTNPDDKRSGIIWIQVAQSYAAMDKKNKVAYDKHLWERWNDTRRRRNEPQDSRSNIRIITRIRESPVDHRRGLEPGTNPSGTDLGNRRRDRTLQKCNT